MAREEMAAGIGVADLLAVPTAPCVNVPGAAMRSDRWRSDGPATLGTTAKAGLLLRTWCRSCRHSVDVDPGEQAARYGAALPVPEYGPLALSARNAAVAQSILSLRRGTPAASGLISPAASSGQAIVMA